LRAHCDQSRQNLAANRAGCADDENTIHAGTILIC
jgi:hypothetical protein